MQLISLRSVTNTRLYFALFHFDVSALIYIIVRSNPHTETHTHTHIHTHTLPLSLTHTLLYCTEPHCNVHRLKAEVASQSQKYHQQNKVSTELKYVRTDYFHMHFKSLDIWFWLKLLYHKVVIFIFLNYF